MSDYQVDGWWQAPDGKWYPPAPTPEPARPVQAPVQASTGGLYGSRQVPSNTYYQANPQYGMPSGNPQANVFIANTSKSPGMAIASLVLGIGAMFFAFLPAVGLASIPFALIGLALGLAGYSRSRKGFEGKGLAIAGSITSSVALLMSAAWLSIFSDATSAINESYGVAPPSAFAITPISCGPDEASVTSYTGSFTNKTSDRRDFAIQVRFRSADGATTTGRAKSGPIEPGQTVPVKATAPFFTGAAPVTCTIERVNYDGD